MASLSVAGTWEGFWWFHWLSWVTVCSRWQKQKKEALPVLEVNRLRLLRRLMVTGPGHRPVLPQPLPLPSLGYHYLQCVTSDSLGQALKQSILHNLENQPSLQKQRGNIGNKDGYIIWRQAFFHAGWIICCPEGGDVERGGGGGEGGREGAWDLSGVRGGGQAAWINVQITAPRPLTLPIAYKQASTFSINGNLIAWKAINGN